MPTEGLLSAAELDRDRSRQVGHLEPLLQAVERFVAYPQEQILVIASEQWSIWREAETLAKPKV